MRLPALFLKVALQSGRLTPAPTFLRRQQAGHFENPLSIIDELLLLAEIRKADIMTQPIDMALVVDEALMRLGLMIEEYQPELELPDAWPAARGYSPWVEEVWANYLSNAMKYGGRPPRIECGATALDEGVVRFWVRDKAY